MSLSLYWVPVVPVHGHDLSESLKFILRENPLWSDNRISIHREAGDLDVPYLSGLRDAKVAGAQELLDAIEKHGVVLVFTE